MGFFDFLRKSKNSTNRTNIATTITNDNIECRATDLNLNNPIPIITKRPPETFYAPQNRNFLFMEKVKNTYKAMCSDITKNFMTKLSNMHLNESKDENALIRLNMYLMEFDRFCAFVFKNWIVHKIPDLTENELKSLDNIANSTLNSMANPKNIGNIPNEELEKLDLTDYFQTTLFHSANRCDDFAKIDINNKYGFYEGKGNEITTNEEYDSEDIKNLVLTFKAMSWMMPDIIYTISKTSKSLPYEKVLEYLKKNYINSNSGKEQDVLQSMYMVGLYGFFGETWLEIVQTVNYIASDEFMK